MANKYLIKWWVEMKNINNSKEDLYLEKNKGSPNYQKFIDEINNI